ncbi:MAG: hypothetical protein LBE12_19965, partial [Planctomycetaceae bacterium]|nr:hypothetical protein [Planctomycetaceae bacterium]
NSTTGPSPYFNFFGGDLNLLRLFDYVRVPSKFAGTIRGWYSDNNNNPKPIYEMREPGKINLNTATEPAWKALRGSSNRTWNGYTDANGLGSLRHKEAIDNNYPSEFIPFRSPQATALVPPLTTIDVVDPDDKDNLVQNPSNTTLLRTGLLKPEPDASNPYTALENYMRLSDMTTTRSNVFAVWITIGYFEVTLGGIDAVYPDGYRLGAEKGLDNGTVKRHRAFYLIDRSIPVGFRRGKVFKQENGDPHYKPIIINSKILE